jgi:hypothetical protein
MTATPAQTTPTPMALYRRGITALQQELGPVDTIRFIHLFDHGSGDYTAERQAEVEADTRPLAELCEEIRGITQS